LLDIVIPRLTISLKKKNGTIFSRVLAVLTIDTEILVSDDGHTVLKCDHIKWTSKMGGGEVWQKWTLVDIEERGEKMPEFCGHLLWMAH